MRLVALFSLLVAARRAVADGGTVWATPHDSYSSSVGVLGCKVNSDRIAYWPGSIDCSNICVSLSYEDRSVYLLRIDQSGGAHDVSYDAWNYLYTGYSATSKPAAGGAIAMEYQDVDVSNCADLIHTDDGKLPLSAANSMNFLSSCLEKDSWIGKNYRLYNILDPICTWGYDEPCTLDWPAANQASCPHALGTPAVLTSAPVWDIKYPSGHKVLAGSPPVPGGPAPPSPDAGNLGKVASKALMALSFATWAICWL
ncbi:allergen Asp f 15 [Echria macrotheca]|uniref:Allergen Asp f 15 n=1 Tax=Echria macrotheca TaxID=438768 RepID=A0AAJ0F9I9_9PEZI|nr:allergen Asp f 15 [Echria macrotheca]